VSTCSYIFDREAARGMLKYLIQDTAALTKYKFKNIDFEHREHIGYLDDGKGNYYSKNGGFIERKSGETDAAFNAKLDKEGIAKFLDYMATYKVIVDNYKAGKTVSTISDFEHGDYINSYFKCEAKNIDYYYDTIRKTTLLREAAKAGTILDAYIYHDDIKGKLEQRSNFKTISFDELKELVGTPIGNVLLDQGYGVSEDSWDFTQESPEEFLKKYMAAESWGHTTMSPMLNALTHGWQPNNFYEIVASSGCGKSMTAFSNLAYGFAEKYYSKTDWKDTNNEEKALYIGTEIIMCSKTRIAYLLEDLMPVT